MKVLYFQHAGSLGGSCTSLLYTLQGLRALGVEATVVLARPSLPVVNYYQAAGFDTVEARGLALLDHSTVARRSWDNPLTYSELLSVSRGWKRTKERTLELVRKLQPDLVHLNSMPLSACGAALADAHVPFVWHVREPPPGRGVRTSFISRQLRRANGLIFLSKFDREQWVQSQRGTVVHNFVDLQRFAPADGQRRLLRREAGISEDAPVVLFLGGLAEAKGLHVLIDAVAILARRFPNLVCLAPGTAVRPPQSSLGKFVARIPFARERLSPAVQARRQMQRRGVEPRFRAVDFQVDVRGLYQLSDLVTFPATAPHFARPVVEASAMALPVVASRVGGMDEIMIDETTGFLARPGDPADLAEKIERLILDPALARDLGRAGRTFAEREFSQPVQVGTIYEIYQRVLAGERV